MKNAALKTTALSLALAFAPLAANSNTGDHPAESNKIEVVKTALTSPQVKAGDSRDAWEASRNGRISLYVQNGTGSAMTPEQLARTFANAFANRDNNGNVINMTDKPIFVSAIHTSRDGERSLIRVYIDGVQQTFNGINSFVPNDLWNGVDAVAERYVAEYGHDKIIPAGSSITVASLD